MKALGVGLWKFAIRDVEVVRRRERRSRRSRCTARRPTLAAERGVPAWQLTLTHTDTMAMAVARRASG